MNNENEGTERRMRKRNAVKLMKSEGKNRRKNVRENEEGSRG